MKDAGIEAAIGGRVKHFFSIYKKMVNQNKTLDQIYDLFAVRIMVETVKDCYAALGVIHEMYKPIPGRFKDYIAMPKQNMYQSLHTTLIGSNGQPFEIQIRTYEMHRTAEYGIAAHWKYKESGSGQVAASSEEAKLSWLCLLYTSIRPCLAAGLLGQFDGQVENFHRNNISFRVPRSHYPDYSPLGEESQWDGRRSRRTARSRVKREKSGKICVRTLTEG